MVHCEAGKKFAQMRTILRSWDCAIRLRNLRTYTFVQRVKNFQRWWCLERGHSTGLGSLCAQTEGKGVSPSWRTSQKPLVQGLEYTCPTLKVTTELQELIAYVSYLYVRWKLEGFNCARNRNCAISRLCTGATQSRDCVTQAQCAAQSRDCANS